MDELKKEENNREELNSDIFLEAAEELKRDTENIGNSEKLSKEKPIDLNKTKKTEKKSEPRIKEVEKENISESENLIANKPKTILETKQTDNNSKEVPQIQKKISGLRYLFRLKSKELENNPPSVQAYNDKKLKFIQKETNELNKIIPFIIERIDQLEKSNKKIKNSSSNKIFHIRKEIRKAQEPISKLADEEKILEEKINENTLRFNKKLLQEMAESKRMIEEEKYELKKHLLETLAKSIQELTLKKEEVDKKILLEIENLKQKIDEGDKNVNQSNVSKIVELRRKLNESKEELQNEITKELEELKKTVERRVDKKIERKIEDSKLKQETSQINEIKTIPRQRVIKEIRVLDEPFERPRLPIKQIETKPLTEIYFDKPSYNPLGFEKPELELKNKNSFFKKEKSSSEEFSSLPEIESLPIDSYDFSKKIMPKKTEPSKILDSKPEQKKSKLKEKMHQEIKETLNQDKLTIIKIPKKKIPKILYLEQPKVDQINLDLADFKKSAKFSEQYFSREVLIKKESHKKVIENCSQDFEKIKKNLSSVISLFSKIKDY